jgi:hypothetical protein
MMLSTEELDRMMNASRDPATPAAAPGRATRAPEPDRAGAPVAGPAPPIKRPRRAGNLVGIGLIVIVATSLGAGFAWLFLR